MNRRGVLKLTSMAIVGASSARAFGDATHKEGYAMTFDRKAVESLAESYTSAWNTGSPQNVAEHFAVSGEIAINRGKTWRGRTGVAEMAAGFFADVPDLRLLCDGVRCAGPHVVYLWTVTGHAATTARALTVHGWEEWELSEDLKVTLSRGWYDAEEYARQVAGGAA
jgi:uncharacterized protein (TIGR02246 family)